jgi:hypothetical protein
MLLRYSPSKPTRALRVTQLKKRLQALTEDYAPFFAGFAADEKRGKQPGHTDRPVILTDLQYLRRVQLAYALERAEESKSKAGGGL